MKQVISHHECLDALHQALADAGQPLDHIIIDDRRHRYPAPDEKRGRKSCWYAAHWLSNGHILCNFGNNILDPAGKGQTWRSYDNQPIDPGELERLRQEADECRRREERRLAWRRLQAAREARTLWDSLDTTGNHPYLERKGVPGLGVRYGRDTYGIFVAVPVRGPDGVLRGIQRIYDGPVRDGRNKHIDSGVEKTGGYHSIGRIETDRPTIYIHEGYATGASGYLATHAPTVIAFDAGNIPHVAEALRKEYPKATLVIGADNDIREPGSKLGNTGVVFARKAAQSFNCRVAIPEWQGRKCDFNDLHQWAGLDEVRRQLENDPNNYPTLTPEAAQEALRGLTRDLLSNPLNDKGNPRRIVFRSTTGSGKTSTVAEELPGVAVRWYAPTIAQAEETTALLKARHMLGRLAPDPESTEKEKMCWRSEEIKAFREKGCHGSEYQSFCYNRNLPPEIGKCPFMGKCGYTRQAINPPNALVLAHEYLTQADAKITSEHNAEIAIVDEAPKCLIRKGVSWELDELIAEGGALAQIAYELAQCKTMREVTADLDVQATIEELETALDTIPFDTPELIPGAPETETLTTLGKYTPNPRTRLYGAYRAFIEALQGKPNRLWYVAGNGGDRPHRIHTAWVDNPTAVKDLPVLILDATADEDVSRAIWGEDVEFHAYHIESSGLHVTQISDRTLRKGMLIENSGGIRERISFLSEMTNAALITHKEALEEMYPPNGTLTANFNGLRGLDYMKDCKALVIAGRIEPPVWVIEEEARALWPDRELSIGHKNLDMVESCYRLRDGTTRPARIRAHPDPLVNRVLMQYRDAELIQAVGRLRAIWGEAGRRLYVLTSVPIPGLKVDDLVTLDELLPDARTCKSLRAGDGVMPMAASALLKLMPGEWPNANTAKVWIRDNLKRGSFSINSILYGKTTPFRYVCYRVDGQRGSDTRALTYLADLDAIRHRLEVLHEKVVTLLNWEVNVPNCNKTPDRDACLWDYVTGSLNRLAELPAEVIEQAPVRVEERQRNERAAVEFLDFLSDLSERYIERAAIQEYEAYSDRDDAEEAIEGDMEAEIAARYEELFGRPYPVDLQAAA